jgi:acetate kinase
MNESIFKVFRVKVIDLKSGSSSLKFILNCHLSDAHECLNYQLPERVNRAHNNIVLIQKASKHEYQIKFQKRRISRIMKTVIKVV